MKRYLILDHSLFSTFWRNPDVGRMQYFRNIAPAESPDYFKLGGCTHKIIELTFGKKSPEQIMKLLKTGKEKYSDTIIQKAIRLADAFHRYRNGVMYDKVAAEKEFTFDLPLKHKSILTQLGFQVICKGRIDEVLTKNKREFLGEIKTEKALAKTDHNYRWKHDTQADMISLGFRGGKPMTTDIMVTVIRDSAPVRVSDFPVTRDKVRLETFLRQLEMTAATIVQFLTVFGTDRPWPHVINAYPCSFGGCEYETICNQFEIDPKALKKSFKTRIEHLESVKGQRVML